MVVPLGTPIHPSRPVLSEAPNVAANITVATQVTVTAAPQNNTTSTTNNLKPSTNELDIDKLIEDLVGSASSPEINLTHNQVHELCYAAIHVFKKQPMLLRLESPINVLGDIHGQFLHLLQHFDHGGFPPKANYLFLGDYVDRGKNSLETICLLLAYKIKYPEKVFLLRGNHESANINIIYGFYDDCKRKYSTKIFQYFQMVFRYMPIAATIGDVIFCCHGGLSPDMINYKEKDLKIINRIVRPTDIPPQGILCDLLWADPEQNVHGYKSSDRGVSYVFGQDMLEEFCKSYGISLVVRAHQVVEDGYEFFPDSENKNLVTLFSAPKYCGEFDNAGAMMIIDENYKISFKIIVDVDNDANTKP